MHAHLHVLRELAKLEQGRVLYVITCLHTAQSKRELSAVGPLKRPQQIVDERNAELFQVSTLIKFFNHLPNISNTKPLPCLERFPAF